MAKKQTVASKVRKLLNDGVSPKDIAKKFNLKPQTVYNIRYQANKKKGVGALPVPELAKEGIATVPRRRGRPPKVSQQPQVIVVPKEKTTQEAFTRIEREAKDATAWGVILLAIAVVAAIMAVTL